MKTLNEQTPIFGNIPPSEPVSGISFGNETRYWKVIRLIELSQTFTPIEVSVDEIFDQLGDCTWFHQDDKPTIKAVVQHMERAIHADSSFPIILNADGKLMDGAHRVVGAKIRGQKKILAVQFVEDPSPDHVEIRT